MDRYSLWKHAIGLFSERLRNHNAEQQKRWAHFGVLTSSELPEVSADWQNRYWRSCSERPSCGNNTPAVTQAQRSRSGAAGRHRC